MSEKQDPRIADPLASAQTAPAPRVTATVAPPSAPPREQEKPEPLLPPPSSGRVEVRYRVTKGGLGHLRTGMTHIHKGKEFGIAYLTAHEAELRASGIEWVKV